MAEQCLTLPFPNLVTYSLETKEMIPVYVFAYHMVHVYGCSVVDLVKH